MKTSHKIIAALVFLTAFLANWFFGSAASEIVISGLLTFLAILALIFSQFIVALYKSDYTYRLFAAIEERRNTRGLYIWRTYVLCGGKTLFLSILSWLVFVFFLINPRLVNHTVYVFAQSFCIALTFLAVVQVPLFARDFLDSLIDEANINHKPNRAATGTPR